MTDTRTAGTMSWQRVTTQEQLEAYQAVLDTEQAYDGSSVEGLQRLLRRGDELWLWDNNRFQVALAMEVRNGEARVVNAVPAGQCTGVQSCRVIITKIREYVDRVDVERFDAKISASYSSPTMQEFLAVLPDVIWELDAEPEMRSGFRRFTFHRKADRKGEDEEYIGPRQRQRLRGGPR
jgi:hypothetical protein